MTFGFPDATNDPRVEGGHLEVFDDDPFRLVRANFALPTTEGTRQSGWGRSYKYKGSGSPSDRCRVVLVKAAIIKAVCREPVPS